MLDIRTMFPSKYLKAVDLEKPVRVTIKSFEQTECFNPRTNKKEPKWILHVRGGTKGIVLSKTKIEQLAEAWGVDAEKWVNKDAVLYTVKTNNGKMGLMLKPYVAKAASTSKPTPAPDGAAAGQIQSEARKPAVGAAGTQAGLASEQGGNAHPQHREPGDESEEEPDLSFDEDKIESVEDAR